MADATAQAPVVERAFIVNAGGDFGHYAFDRDRGADRAYGVFFADMKKWAAMKLCLEIKRRECAVSELYDMSHAGTYFIEVQQLDGRPAQSNTLVLTVVP